MSILDDALFKSILDFFLMLYYIFFRYRQFYVNFIFLKTNRKCGKKKFETVINCHGIH